jgi:phospholipid/cholesterol/gamma-HCH transport system permease protein
MQDAQIHWQPEVSSYRCTGEWTLSCLSELEKTLSTLQWPEGQRVIIDGSGINHLDTIGAWCLVKCLDALAKKNNRVELRGFSRTQESMLQPLQAQADKILVTEPYLPREPGLTRLGRLTVLKFWVLVTFLNFIGECAVAIRTLMRLPKRLPWSSVVAVIDQAGYRALPIIGLLNFLIGVVLAYQLGMELRYYGANIYIVDLSGLAILREFGPLVTAIVLAGRTSSAFTAEIGTMKVNEEVDALRTLGLDPIDWLVLPKVIGLIIVMPLVTLWADMTGLLGSMMMAHNTLDIGFYDFIQRLQSVIQLQTYVIGMSKAPVFAMIISLVGCFHGFQVSHDAESVGRETTRSVVKALFLIIIADALFSVMFEWQGI